MAMNNAERQAAYRARHLNAKAGNGERLNLIIDLKAKKAFERLAVCYGVTQKEVIERLALGAEQATLNAAKKMPNGQKHYYDGRLRLGLDDVTQ